MNVSCPSRTREEAPTGDTSCYQVAERSGDRVSPRAPPSRTAGLADCGHDRRRSEAPPSGHRQPLLPRVLRRARRGQGAGRNLGERGPRAARHGREARDDLPAHAPRGLLGRRLASAVAGRPHSELQGAPRRRGRPRRRRRRGGAGSARGADPDHPRGARGAAHPCHRRRGARGRRCDRHPRDRVGHARRHHHRRQGPVPARGRRPRSQGDLHRPRDEQPRGPHRGGGGAQVRRAPEPVRRLRHDARRRLRRAPRRGRGRREDRREPPRRARRPHGDPRRCRRR